MKTILDLQAMKQKNEKISFVTCYDYCFAKIINSSDIDGILIGDSASMVMHGFDSTVHATVDMIAMHFIFNMLCASLVMSQHKSFLHFKLRTHIFWLLVGRDFGQVCQ